MKKKELKCSQCHKMFIPPTMLPESDVKSFLCLQCFMKIVNQVPTDEEIINGKQKIVTVMKDFPHVVSLTPSTGVIEKTLGDAQKTCQRHLHDQRGKTRLRKPRSLKWLAMCIEGDSWNVRLGWDFYICSSSITDAPFLLLRRYAQRLNEMVAYIEQERNRVK